MFGVKINNKYTQFIKSNQELILEPWFFMFLDKAKDKSLFNHLALLLKFVFATLA